MGVNELHALAEEGTHGRQPDCTARQGSLVSPPPARVSPIRRAWRRLRVWQCKSGIVLTNLRRNRSTVAAILFSGRQAPVRAEIIRQPSITKFVAVPFLCSHWDAQTRIERIIDHCLIADALGPPFSRKARKPYRLADLPGNLSTYALTLRTPPAMVREGLLTLSVLHEGKPMFDISFIFAPGAGGLHLYIGAIQGRADEGALDLYRTFTKAACGVRPRDFVVEALRIICRKIGVVRIHAVSNAARHQQSEYFSIGATDYDQVKLNYDELWAERGGELDKDGWFVLSPATPQRPLDSIPARKRSLYKRRAAMWQEIEAAMFAAMAVMDDDDG